MCLDELASSIAGDRDSVLGVVPWGGRYRGGLSDVWLARHGNRGTQHHGTDTEPRIRRRSSCSINGGGRECDGHTRFDDTHASRCGAGCGMARRIIALDLGVIRTIFLSWIVTLPAGAILAVVLYYILSKD